MPIGSLDHFNVRTPDLESARRFYVDVLGLAVGDRPPFPFPGLWLYSGDGRPVLHLVGIDPAAAGGTGTGTGPIDHMAFAADDVDAMRERLRDAGMEFTERTVPLLGLRQIFVQDPHGIRIELNFPAAGGTV